ncbi:double zinc ribbon domain-containing protein [Treponema medium]|uniref:double zinc ribbon domain-containing protein n=1 Tax=Treponema medium TaxID=58231 RepID=UPI0030B86F13
MNKQPKFFCENCNAEVRRDAVICPYCGRFFASVRCPSCGFTGTHKEFKDGCPSCGYAFTPDVQENKKSKTKKRKKRNFILCDIPKVKPISAPILTLYPYGYTG